MMAIMQMISWILSTCVLYKEHNRLMAHSWHIIFWWTGSFIIHSVLIQSLLKEPKLDIPSLVSNCIEFVPIGILAYGSFFYNVEPRKREFENSDKELSDSLSLSMSSESIHRYEHVNDDQNRFLTEVSMENLPANDNLKNSNSENSADLDLSSSFSSDKNNADRSGYNSSAISGNTSDDEDGVVNFNQLKQTKIVGMYSESSGKYSHKSRVIECGVFEDGSTPRNPPVDQRIFGDANPNDVQENKMNNGRETLKNRKFLSEIEDLNYSYSDNETLSPEERSSFFSSITFSWLTPILTAGYRCPLSESDLPPLSRIDHTSVVYSKFKQSWEKEKLKSNPSILGPIISNFGEDFFLAGILKILHDIFAFFSPILLSMLIKFMSNNKPFYVGVLITFGMAATSILQSFIINAYFFRLFRMGMHLRVVLTQLIYEKALRMSFEARRRYTVGEIVNHQSVDTSCMEKACPYLHIIWNGPFQIIISLILLYRILGYSVVASLLVLILLIPLNMVISRILSKNHRKVMKVKDARNRLMNEILQGIRIIKYFTWEDCFVEKLENIREKELSQMRYGAFWRAILSVILSGSTVLVSLVTFTMFTLTGHSLTADIIFTALALFNILRFPINVFPSVISSFIECRVSVKRINDYMVSDELDPDTIKQDFNIPYAVSVENASFTWEVGNVFLRNLDISIPRGSLVAVVGTIGSGKSSLLLALLGEMLKVDGTVFVNGSVAYCPQQAWIQNATFEQNLKFERTISDEKYRHSIDVCALRADIENLVAGENTEIGEKGVNLSGGQKQRISLARAVCQNADIYLLDDPLSAVDVHVGKHIFEECILKSLKDKTRILVTHHLQYLDRVDYIILMEAGKIVEQGTYADLVEKKGKFSEIISDNNFFKEIKNTKDDSKETEVNKCDSEPLILKGKLKNDGNHTIVEKPSSGKISKHTYLLYINMVGGIFFVIILISFFVLEYTSKIGTDLWLSYWSGKANSNNSEHSMKWYLAIYTIIASSVNIFIFVRSFMIVVGLFRAARGFHYRMLKSVLRAPITWFERVPLGRIMNRFSKDQYSIDESLIQTLTSALSTLFSVSSIAIVTFSINPWLVVFMLPLGFLYKYIQQYYLFSSRELKRLNSISRSPIFSLLSETLNGLTTIRAYSRCQDFIISNQNRLDNNQKAYFLLTVANRWLGLRLEFVGISLIFGTAFFAILGRNTMFVGAAGLSITYALQLTSQLNWFVRMSTDVENEFTSVERCEEYINLTPEAPRIIEPRPSTSWPNSGEIKFNRISISYREDIPPVIKDISFTIRAQEKIGIVGRTGAGKSTLVNVLFRMIEPDEGSILIDGIDIMSIGLDDLRSKLAIIPQDTVLFTGTIRSNLDPFGCYDDEKLWMTLEDVQMKDKVAQMDKQLDAPVHEYGENLSAGSRKLLCLARAILRKPKILVMDEATSNIDYGSDGRVQLAIRKEFKDATTITIAHRLATISDCDRIMVLESGRIVEFDTPENLSNNPNSLYSEMIKALSK